MPWLKKTELLDQLGQMLRGEGVTYEHVITDAVYDGDNKSGSLVLVTEGPGGDDHQEWLIRSMDLQELPEELDSIEAVDQAEQIRKFSPPRG
jgi:hypothetical protein